MICTRSVHVRRSRGQQVWMALELATDRRSGLCYHKIVADSRAGVYCNENRGYTVSANL